LISRIAAALGLALGFQAAALGNDRFDPQSYPKGGFAPVSNPTYAKECGSCHFAYLPVLLPVRSWRAVLANTNEHFGESLGLSPATVAALQSYLAENAGDHSDRDGPAILFKYLSESRTPLRVTSLPMMHRNHEVVRSVIRTNATMKIRSITNCAECHTKAGEGSFANRDLIVPGVTTSHETPMPAS
jgi:hypothetical protein